MLTACLTGTKRRPLCHGQVGRKGMGRGISWETYQGKKAQSPGNVGGTTMSSFDVLLASKQAESEALAATNIPEAQLPLEPVSLC